MVYTFRMKIEVVIPYDGAASKNRMHSYGNGRVYSSSGYKAWRDALKLMLHGGGEGVFTGGEHALCLWGRTSDRSHIVERLAVAHHRLPSAVAAETDAEELAAALVEVVRVQPLALVGHCFVPSFLLFCSQTFLGVL